MARFRDKASVPIRLDGMGKAVHASFYRFDRNRILRDSPQGILTRFNVGDASLTAAIETARGHAAEETFVYNGVNFEEVGDAVLFLRPAGRELGIDYLFAAAGAAEDPFRVQNLENLVDENPFDPDFDPRKTAREKKAGEAPKAAGHDMDTEYVPLFIQAGVRNFGDSATGPILDFTVKMDGDLLYAKKVDSKAPRYKDGFTALSIPKGDHSLIIVSNTLNKRWDRRLVATKPTWVVISYDYYGPEHPQRLKEGFVLDIYDHEVFPR